MAKWIKSIEQEINAKEGRVNNLRARITKLQSQPDPDLAQIQELEEDIRELERQLESDRPQLPAFEEEFLAVCT